jgi:lipoprotein-anchoring transpeptidase ErfK/SrfK
MRMKRIGAIILAVALALSGAAMAKSTAQKAAAPRTTVLISINKISQKMTVSVNGERKYVWLVSTGAQGYSTPSGTYRPFRMEVDHFSEEWDDAPMPHSIFFTPEGHAIHGSFYTKRLGTRASHGCVRLAPDNATTLYTLVQKAGMKNTTVVVRGGFDWGFSELTPPRITPPKWLKKTPAKIKGLFGG